MSAGGSLAVFIVAGEESGDQLGARLMAALRRAEPAVRFAGVGGPRMAGEGLASLFPLHDIAVMGIGPVLARLPTLLRRIDETAAAAIAAQPDVLVVIDSPDFTHRVARRVRKARPAIPIVDYVSPSVWAWRPGRARRMAGYVDRLLALLPFEPAVHARLGGPRTVYVGHPLTDRPELLRPAPGEREPLEHPPISLDQPDRKAAASAIESGAFSCRSDDLVRSDNVPGEGRVPTLLVLPGSRGGEIDRLLGLYGAVVARLAASGRRFRLRIPAVDRFAERIAAETRGWAVAPEIVTGEAEKWAAFRSAHAALATSGTVTLELALAGVPTVVAYARDPLFRLVTEIVRRIPGQVQVASFVLPNIILGDNVVSEHLDPDLDPERLAAELAALMADTPARRDQCAALDRLWTLMAPPGGATAAEAAAAVVLDLVRGNPRSAA